MKNHRFRIVIFEIDQTMSGNNGQKIDRVNNFLVTWASDWIEVAKKEFKENWPGSKKEIIIYEGDKIVKHHKNF